MNPILKTAPMAAGLSLAALLIAAPVHAQSSNTAQNTAPQTTKMQVEWKGYLFGIRVMKADIKTEVTDTDYTAFADLRTSGLGAFLKKFKIWSLTRGRFDGDTMRPKTHLQQNLDKKSRRVQMRYGQDAVDISIVPRLGSQGKPPASQRQRFESFDTLSAILNMMLRGHSASDAPCSGKVPVFDSKQHYNLRLKQAGTKRIKHKGFKGAAIRCLVYYEPVAGFDPEDLPSAEEIGTPITVYLANYPAQNIYVPVRAEYKISGFKAVIKARNINFTTGPKSQFRKFGDSFDAQEAKLRSTGMLNTDKYDDDD